MNSHVVEHGSCSDAAPGVLQIGQMGVGVLADDDSGMVFRTGKAVNASIVTVRPGGDG